MADLKATIVESVIGLFAINGNNAIVDQVFFPKRVVAVGDSLRRLQQGVVIPEVITLMTRLTQKGYSTFTFGNNALAEAVVGHYNIITHVEKNSAAESYIRDNLARLATAKDFVKNLSEFNRFVHDVFVEMARDNIKQVLGRKDLIVSQAVLVMDDLDKTFNLFTNRLREWYGYYFPELGNQINKSDIYVQSIVELGTRDHFETKRLITMGVNPQKAETVSRMATTSMGSDLDVKDVEEIRHLAQILLGLLDSRGRLEKYLDDLMGTVAPNIRELAGSTLGARLIAAAGSLENLAKKPSGTIQILGAEKALFRSLKTGARPPKHGLLFQHKDVRQSPRWQRGKIARTLASKLSIAARLDAYGGKYLGDKLKEAFNDRLDEIRAKYAEPPAKGSR
jgi:nucleolar protein 56